MTETCTYTQIMVNANRYDPTRTTALRNAFVREIHRRFGELVRVVRQTVDKDDCFGLRKVQIMQMISPGNAAFAFPRSQDKVAMFMRWLEQQVDRGLLQVGELPQVGEAMEGAWTNRYVFDSYKRGVIRARYEMQKAGYKVPSIEQTGGIEISMATPFHIDRLGLLYTRVFNELKGVTATMDTQISRVLSQGIADGDNPRLLARKLVATIDGTGMGELGITDTLGRYIPAARRAEMIARTEVIRAHHLATIQEYRNWAVEGVRVKAEWKTAGLTDKRTCDECKELEGHIFSLDEIEKKIPLHPMCRCVALPYIVKGVGTYGGPGSGNFGHAGRPGKVGGSSDEDVVRENTFTQDKLKFNYADITEEELKAMKEYQHGLYRSEVGGFSTLQTYLRDKTISESLRKEGVTEEKVQKYVDDISSAVAKSVIAKDSVVYRGIRNTAETFGITDISQLKVGFQFTDKAFTSTSSAYSIASRFASKLNHWEDPRILNITLDKGQSAFPMNLIGVSKEREVVLPTGSRFEVTRIFGRNIDLKVIHD